MNRQIRNIANAYLLIMGLVLMLLVLITIRVVDVYYNKEANAILDKRVEQLESIYTNYHDASKRLNALNAESIDKNLVVIMDGVLDILAQSTPNTSDLTDQIDLMFANLDQHRFHLVSEDQYVEFMQSTYNITVQPFDAKLNFHTSVHDGETWRIAEKYIESMNKILVVSEDITEVKGLEASFKSDVAGRIEEHLMREPMAVSVMLINEDEQVFYCSEHGMEENPSHHKDNLTGKSIVELVHELRNGHFEYQVHDEDGYRDYYAITRMSQQYDAHIILSMRKKEITNKFGQNTGIFVQILFVILLSAIIWTVFRFRRILKQGEITRPGSTREKNSIF